eukprot:Gb_18177 [translate_table: standard]
MQKRAFTYLGMESKTLLYGDFESLKLSEIACIMAMDNLQEVDILLIIVDLKVQIGLTTPGLQSLDPTWGIAPRTLPSNAAPWTLLLVTRPSLGSGSYSLGSIKASPGVSPTRLCRRVTAGSGLWVMSEVLFELVVRLTKDIIETYRVCKPTFTYSKSLNPKRYLTNPSTGVLNDGLDNLNSDYILAVNAALINSDFNRRYDLIVAELAGEFHRA